ncbi:hypothetical protein RA27_00255 [Ruegeria sp. ANG-R]|nr:hypothetical protein RA27_00255 [Ruegeria sp. ANG-R]
MPSISEGQRHHFVGTDVANDVFATRFLHSFGAIDVNGVVNLGYLPNPETIHPEGVLDTKGSSHTGSHPRYDLATERMLNGIDGLKETDFKAKVTELIDEITSEGSDIIDASGEIVDEAAFKARVADTFAEEVEIFKLASIYLRTKLVPGASQILELQNDADFLDGDHLDLEGELDARPSVFLNQTDPRLAELSAVEGKSTGAILDELLAKEVNANAFTSSEIFTNTALRTSLLNLPDGIGSGTLEDIFSGMRGADDGLPFRTLLTGISGLNGISQELVDKVNLLNLKATVPDLRNLTNDSGGLKGEGPVSVVAIGAIGVALVKIAERQDKTLGELMEDLELTDVLNANTLRAAAKEALIVGIESVVLGAVSGGVGFAIRIVYSVLDSIDLIDVALDLLKIAYPDAEWVDVARAGFDVVKEYAEFVPDIRLSTLLATDDEVSTVLNGDNDADIIQITDDADINGSAQDIVNLQVISAMGGDDIVTAHFEGGAQEFLHVYLGDGHDRALLTGDVDYTVGDARVQGFSETSNAGNDWIRTDAGDDTIFAGSGFNFISAGDGTDEVWLQGGIDTSDGNHWNANIIHMDGDANEDLYRLFVTSSQPVETALIFSDERATPEDFMKRTTEDRAATGDQPARDGFDDFIRSALPAELVGKLYDIADPQKDGDNFVNVLLGHDGTGQERFQLSTDDDVLHLVGESSNTAAGIILDGQDGDDTLNLSAKSDALNMSIAEEDGVLSATYQNGAVVDQAISFEAFDLASHHFDAILSYQNPQQAELDLGQMGAWDISGIDGLSLTGDAAADGEKQTPFLELDWGEAEVTFAQRATDSTDPEEIPDGGFLVHNFDVAAQGTEGTRIITLDPTLTDAARQDQLLTIDGDKQLLGGAGFDLDKFDYAHNLGASRYYPAFNNTGYDPILEEQAYLDGALEAYQRVADIGLAVAGVGGGIGALTARATGGLGGALWAGLMGTTFIAMAILENTKFKTAYQPIQSRKYFGVHGEQYILGEQQEGGGQKLTIIVDPEDTAARQEIIVNNWKQGDLGIRLEIQAAGQGFDIPGNGTARDGKLVTEQDLSDANFSDEYIRGLLEPLGFVPQNLSSGQNPEPPMAAAAAAPEGSSGSDSGFVRQGSDQSETLGGRAGADTLIGHAGDDTLVGAGGRDVYVFDVGDGADTIIDTSSEGGVIRFRSDVDFASITYEEVPGDAGQTDYLITYGTGDSIRIKDWSKLDTATQAAWTFEELGPTADVPQSYLDVPDRSEPTPILQGTADDDTLRGTERADVMEGYGGNDDISGGGGADIITGGSGNDLLLGGAGRDQLDGGDGDDILAGGIGRDILNGGGGNDTYLFDLGDGADSITDSSGFNTLRFGPGIVASDIQITRSTVSNTVLTIASSGETVTIFGQYASDGSAGSGGVDRIEFADGVIWNRTDIEQIYLAQNRTSGADNLIGFDGRDIMIGGQGDDHLSGAGGADDYIWNLGDGNDQITDGATSSDPSASNRLLLGEGIAPEDVSIQRGGGEVSGVYWNGEEYVETASNPGDLFLIIAGDDGGMIEINGYFDGRGINLINFADGTVWTRDYIYERSNQEQVTDGNDRIYGTPDDDVIDGGAGNDLIEDGAGDDTLIGGAGDDELGRAYSSEGDDTFVGGAGDDTLIGWTGRDTYVFGAGFGNDRVIDGRSEFADGSENRMVFTHHTLSDFTFLATGDQGLDLLMQTSDGLNSVYVQNWVQRKWVSTSGGWGEIRWQSLGDFEFADGQIVSSAQIAAIAEIAGEIPSSQHGTDSADVLNGTEQRDRIVGGDGDDQISGGDGADYLLGGSGEDQITGDDGADVITGGDGGDTVHAGTGDDLIFGGAGADDLSGDGDNDFVGGGAGADTLSGGAGDDELHGDGGDDILTGGRGNDELTGGAGSDTYHFNFGDGQDEIDMRSGGASGDVEILELGPGLTLNMMRFEFFDGTVNTPPGLRISFANGTTDHIHLVDALSGGLPTEIRFSDGFSITGQELLTLAVGSTDGDDAIVGSAEFEDRNWKIQYGGAGDDFHNDLNANTAIIFGRNDGNDRVHVRDNTFLFNGEYDVRVQILGYTSDETIISRGGPENDDLIISFTTGSDTLTDINHFGPAGLFANDGIDSIRFEDGTIWNADELARRTGDASGTGSDADETITGTSSDESFDGAGGDDTYVYEQGGGSDVIADSGAEAGETDTLELGAGIVPQNVTVERNGNDLILTIGSETITLSGQLSGGGAGVERVAFTNGDVWTRDTLISKLAEEQSSAGDDVISGGEGEQTLDGGTGSDTLDGGAGGDTYVYRLGDGDDVIVEGATTGTDRLQFETSVDSQSTQLLRDVANPDDLLIRTQDGATVRVVDQFADGGLEEIRFTDGTFLNRVAIEERSLADSQSDGDDFIVGTDGADVFRAGKGNDQIDGGLGADVYTFNPGDGVNVIADSGAGNEDGLTIGGGLTSDDVSFARVGDDLVLTFPGMPGDQITITDHFDGHAVAGILFSDGALWSAEMVSHMAENGTMLPGAEPEMVPVPPSGPFEAQVAIEDEAFSFTLPSGVFQNAGSVVISLANGDPLPSWLSFADGTFTGTPGADDVGVLELELSGLDANGDPRTETLYVGVADVNDAPVANGSIADTEVLSNQDMFVDLSSADFSDEDDSELFLRLEMADGSDLPTWLSFDQVAMTVTGRPPSYLVSAQDPVLGIELRLIAEDDAGLTVEQDFTLSVRRSDPTSTRDGTTGDDTLTGSRGANIFQGYEGNDTFRGNGGDDIYVFGLGDGQDYIDRDNTDSRRDDSTGGTIRFGEGISADDIVLSRTGYTDDAGIADYEYYENDLIITFANSPGDRLEIEGQFDPMVDGKPTISRVEFHDGTIWTADDLVAPFLVPSSEIVGGSTDDIITGSAADETLIGLYGDDTLDGGAGDDVLAGGYGNDTYVFGYGSGHDQIIDLRDDHKPITIDTLRFGPGISVDDLTFELTNEAPNWLSSSPGRAGLRIGLKDSPDDSILLTDQYMFQIGRSYGIDRFVFEDETELTLQDLDNLIVGDGARTGTAGDDVIIGTTADELITGGAGVDRLYGGLGDDIYFWAPGDGNDVITESDDRTFDILQLGGSLTANDVVMRRGEGNQSDNLYLDIIPTGESILISSQFQVSLEEFDPNSSDERLVLVPVIDEIRFSDGTAWNYEYIRDLFTTGTPDDQVLHGYEFQDDVLDGGAGDDVLMGYGGDDVYVFGRGYGHDTIKEYGPYNLFERDLNVIRFVGNIRPEDVRVERIEGPDAQSGVYHRFVIADTGESITIGDDIDLGRRMQYEVRFEDAGITWDLDDVTKAYLEAIPTDGDDLYRGSGTYSFSKGGTINTGAGDDTLVYTANDNLSGGSGSDTYLPGALADHGVRIEDIGDVSDVDRLHLEFGSVSEPINVSIDNNGRDLLIWEFSDNRAITLVDMVAPAPGSGIEEIILSDGTILDGDWLRANATASSASANVQTGTTDADTLSNGTNSYTDTTFDGGLGDDVLTGSINASDVYLWRPGDGNDRIVDATGGDYVEERDILVMQGVSINDVTLTISGDHLLITHVPTGEVLEVTDHHSRTVTDGYRAGVEEIVFDDGRYYGRDQIDNATRVLGTSADERLDGGYWGDTFDGGLGNDTLVSGPTFEDDDAAETFLYRAGDGNDWIFDDNRSFDADDRLVFLDLNQADIQLSRSGHTLRIDILPTGEVINVANQFYRSYEARGIERIEFEDGSSINGRQAIANLAHIRGDSGNNTLSDPGYGGVLVGEEGNDLLRGGYGDHEYWFSAGDGADIIDEHVTTGSDSIVFDGTVSEEDVSFSRSSNGENLIVTYGSGDSITVLDHLIRPGGEIDRIVFDNGTEWLQEEFIARMNNAGAGDDTVIGSADGETLAGFGGDDILQGLGGEDIYEYGLGDGSDIIRDGGSDEHEIDVLRLGAGILPDEVVVSRDGDNIVLTITATGDTLTLENRLVDVRASADAVQFDDGTYWDYFELLRLSDPALNNDAPTPSDDLATTAVDTAISFDVSELLANDSDPNGDALTLTSVLAPVGGDVALDGNTVTFTPSAGFAGLAEFVYTVTDVFGAISSATTQIKVGDGNIQPTADSDAASVVEDGSILIDVLANDSDFDDDSLTITSVTGAANGTLSIEANQIRYTPNANYYGVETLTYTVDDGNGGTATATITVDVIADNDAPIAVSDVATVAEDSDTLIDALANDSDVDGDTLSITGVSGALNGTAGIENGQIRYTPNANFNGSETLIYTVDDGNGSTATATVIVTVTPENDGPVANQDAAVVVEDGSMLIDVLANDIDIDGDPLTISDVSGAVNGTATVENGQIRYAPNADFNGSETLTYTVDDGNGGSDTASVTVTVTAENDDPTAMDDSVVADENIAVVIDVLANDGDIEGHTLTITEIDGQAVSVGSVVTLNSGASVELMPDNSLRFEQNGAYTTLNDGETAQETVTYTVDDGNGGTATAVANITISGRGTAPTPIGESGTVSVAQTGPDQWHSVSFSAAISDAVVVLGPVTNVDGDPVTTRVRNVTDTGFEFQIDEWDYLDGTHGLESLGWLAVSAGTHELESGQKIVAGTASVSTGFTQLSYGETLVNPIVLSEVTSVNETDAVTTRMRNVTNTGFQAQIEEQESSGAHVAETVSWIALESGAGAGFEAFRTADQLDERVDRFDFTTSFGSAPVLLADMQSTDGGDTSTVRMQSLDATGVSLFVAEEQSKNVEVGHTNETAGILALSGGLLFAGGATANSAPDAVDDSITVTEDGTVLIDVLGNDSDADGDALTITAVSGATNGTAVIEAGQIRYTPTTDFNGTETLTYTIDDGNGEADTATVTIDVIASNDAPEAVDDASSVVEDGTVLIDVLANDTDIDVDTLTITGVAGAINGTAVIEAGQIRYTPNADFNGSETLTYTVDDGNDGTDTATVTVTVTPANDAPVASDDMASLDEDGTILIDVLSNDSDVDGNTLTIAGVIGAANGTASVEAGQIRYTPNAGFAGSETLTYTIDDGNGGTDTATVSVTVIQGNDVPIAINDSASLNQDGTVLIDVLANDSDPDGDALTITGVVGALNGTAVIEAGQIRYTPASGFSGTDTINYTISDGAGGTASASVAIQVNAVPTGAPIVVDDYVTIVSGGTILIDALANDSDPEGGQIYISSVAPTIAKSIQFVDGKILYEAFENYTGIVEMDYTVSDFDGNSTTGTVFIDIVAPNTGPIANNDTASTTENESVLIDVLANDDAGGGTLSIASVTAALSGTAVIENGQIRYTPNTDFNGSDTINYTISDGNGGEATASVQIDVAELIDGAPIVVDDYVTVESGGTILIDALANDSDPNGDGIYISNVAPTIAQSLQFVNGMIQYEALANYTGVVEMVYTVTDYGGTSSTGSVFIDVVAPGSIPPAAATAAAPLEVTGTSGNNILTSTEADEVFTGGGGADVFVFNALEAEGVDSITDFELGIDTIELEGSTYADLTFIDTGSSTRVEWNNGSVELDGIAVASLTEDQFLFV